MRKVILQSVFILILLVGLSCRVHAQLPNKDYSNITFTKEEHVNVALGVPKDIYPENDYIIARTQYVLSYNPDLLIPNWVSWNLNKDWFGKTGRTQSKFFPDDMLPGKYYHVKQTDYNKGGYDRGHMCPSEQRTATLDDNKATFYTTNIMPQMADLNQGVWRKQEVWCKNMCLDSNAELYIISGGVFKAKGTVKKMNKKIAIPDSCFKIIVVLKQGEGLKDVTKDTRIEAVVMPNKAGVRNDDWKKYKRTVRQIEASTGYDFLSDVPKDIQDVIENKK